MQIDHTLTHLAYFGLDIGADGTILNRTADGSLEPGFRTLNDENFLEFSQDVLGQDKKFELVLKQFSSKDIATFLSNEKNFDTFLTSLDSLLLAYPVTGINIDIEYAGENSQSLRAPLTQFMTALSQHLRSRYKNIQLSIDVYASAASNDQSLWDIRALGSLVDYVIVMAYDFHQRGSTQAGPVAPLFSEDDTWSSDINRHLKNFLDQMPREKILLGIPFYGYAWQTEATTPRANTFEDSGFTVSYKKAKELLKLAKGQASTESAWVGATSIKQDFDSEALSPFITYQQEGKFYTLYYEDPQSINYKLAYARQLDLGGIAIWALGYEDSERELWQVIEDGI